MLKKKDTEENIFFKFWPRTNPISLKFNQQQNQLISAKQPNLIITRNGFDIIVN